MGQMCARAILIFIIGYLGSISAYTVSGDCSVCGVGLPEHTPNFLIRFGKPIRDSRRFPWMVSLREDDDPEMNACGGAILDEYFILTAAHCVSDRDGELLYNRKVYFQTRSVRKMSRGAAVEKIIIHPKYKLIKTSTDVTIAQYDIALMKLKNKIKCDMYKRPICLPRPSWKIPFGKVLIVAGWGTPYAGYEGQSKVLNYGIVKHLPFNRCIKALPETRRIRDHNLCLGETNQTVCYGDSGSPMFHKIDSRYYVVGVASSETDSSCPSNKPIMYVDVAKFVSWIFSSKKLGWRWRNKRDGEKVEKS